MLGKIVVALAVGLAVAQRPNNPPPLPFFANYGQVQGHRFSGNGDSVHRLDVWLGPFCEDSNAFYPTMKQLAAHYGPKLLEVRVHLFPLPYNFGSFIVAQACAAVHAIADLPKGHLVQDGYFSCLDYLYSHQHDIKLLSQFNQTQPESVTHWADIAEKSLSILRSDFLLQMDISNLEGGNTSYDLAKQDFKYGASLGVFGTPSYFVNDVQLGQSADYMGRWNFTRWQEILDPVVKPLDTGVTHGFEI